MKKIILTMVLFCAVCVSALAQNTITMKFSGRNQNNEWIPLSNVLVENQTQNWQEMIYYPDTMITMGSGVGIDDYLQNEKVKLFQNVPNPFDGVTDFALQLDEGQRVLLEIYDVNGKMVAQYENALPQGQHLFRATLTAPQTYLLSAKTENDRLHIKMVNKGNGGENSIAYLGEGGSIQYQLKSDTKDDATHNFAIGDWMKYVGYANLCGTEYESVPVEKSQTQSETVNLVFTLPLAAVTVENATNINSTSARLNGNANGQGCEVTERGFFYGMTANNLTTKVTASGVGNGDFQTEISNLLPGTHYYYKAYAKTITGMAYSNEISFQTNATLPTITTPSVSSITSMSATSGGNVTADGGASVTARGVCWSTSQNPTTSSSHTSDGSGTGGFTSSMTGLSANTTYYVRAYATNSVGTAYGNQVSFTTLAPTTATVTTDSVSSITSTTAISGGNVTADGGASVTARGVCWSTSQNPTVSNSHTTNGSGTGSFTSSMTGLTAGTTYYVRAYATNSVGTAYGNQVSFTTPATLPTVSTTTVTSITSTSATSGGNVTATGGASVTARGVCWSTSQNPTVSNSHTTNGSGTGSFTSSMTGLTAGTTYYVRAYATNSAGTAYGNQVSFTPPATLPTVSTTTVTSITSTSATSGGNVTATGGASVTARGVCWSTNQNPTTSNSHTSDGNGTGNFTSSMTGLTPGTTYYVRAYATNSAGTVYGEQRSFTTTILFICGFSTVSDYDGNTYNTVRIGQQCWMKQNLKTTHYSDGTSISLGSTMSETTAYRYNPDGNSSNVNTYGYLYNWKAVMGNSYFSSNNPSGVQDICPVGWHVPSDAEWMQLADYVNSQRAYQCDGDSYNIAKALASTTGWNNKEQTCAVGYMPSENNATGFTVVPAGYYDGSYHGFGDYANFWCATEYDSSYAYNRYLNNYGGFLHGSSSNKNVGYSVRCLWDGIAGFEGQPCPDAATVTDYDGNTYNTVQIGQQCWMKQNLKTTHYSDGTSISLGSSTSTSTAYRYYPNNYSSNVGAYGYLYNWKAVMRNSSSSNSIPSGVQGICPTGWHVPSDAEWTQLIDYVSSQNQYVCGFSNMYIAIAKALASTTGWNNAGYLCTASSNPSDNNATGFTAVPAGCYYGAFDEFHERAYFWSSTQYNIANAYCRYISYNHENVILDDFDKYIAYSVRCLRNDGGVDAPIITTSSVSSVTFTSAIGGGNITADGGGAVTARGICWSTSQNPTISNNHTTNGSGMGGFTSSITNLTPATTYYVRAYATNSAGTAYGNQVSFTTTPDDGQFCLGESTVTDYDGNIYTTVKIGQQCWMKQNLRTTHYSDGTSIPLGSTMSLTTAYCYYPDDNYNNVSMYGYLYNWKAVMRDTPSSTVNPSRVQGICPPGWHVPSDAEWTQLTDYLSSQSAYQCDGSSSKIAKALASTTNWNSSTNTCAVGNTLSDNNATGFTAIPAGVYMNSGYPIVHNGCFYFGDRARYWSATELNNSDASYCHIDYDSYDVSNSSVAKKNGCSVRCLRNDSEVDGQSCPGATTVTDYDGNTYYTVQMGDQCWMKQNLKTTHYADGTSISLSSSMSESVTTPYRYYPYSNSSNVNNLGYLYNWKAVMRNDSSSTSNPSGVQGICPNGWHVPSNAEWTQLENYVSSQSEYVCGSSNTNIAKALASTTSWSSSTGTCEVGNTPSTNNATDFSAAPAGSNGYYSFGNYAYFWSATQHDSSYAYFRELSFNSTCVLSGILNKRSGLSVRCIRDVNTITDGDPCREAAMVTDYDGNTYNTVKIGGQCWMKQNLKTTHYSDGTSISLGSSTSNSTAYRYNPNGSSSDVSTYGYLYNWEAVMRNDLSSTSNPSGVQGICPTGWHVPSEAEWTQLIDYLSSQSQYVCGSSNMYIAKALASTAYWNSDGGSCAVGYMPSENNATGFTVVPAGYYDGSYYGFGGYAHFWSATQYNSSNAYNRYLNNNGGFVHGSSSNKNVGYSVRCLRDENVPTVTTATVSSITSTSATSGGIVSDDGGASVTARGVCWSKTQNPVIYNAHTIDDSGMGSFASSMTELTPGTTYYVRAYATNSQGTVYGEQRSFTTLAPAVATVSTTSVSSIFSKSATCGGYVAADGGALVTVRGVCWNTSQTPTISNSHTNDAIGTGGFTSSITGLTAGTTYYVRAYATNSAGTAYGSQVCFTTLPEDGQPCPGTSTVIDYDSNTYNTLWIGQQCWMKQNLKTTHYSDGTSISLGSGTSTSTAYRYYPNNSSSSVSTYGYLYNWKAVMRNSSSNSNNPSGVQGICPTGWHVPSDAEWTQLTDYVSNQSQYMCGSSNTSIAKALASTTDWDTYFGSCVVGSSPSSNNTTGFTAVPAGYYYSSVGDFGRSAYFWSTTQYNSNDAYCRYLRYSSASVLRSNRGKGNGLSVRCVRD